MYMSGLNYLLLSSQDSGSLTGITKRYEQRKSRKHTERSKEGLGRLADACIRGTPRPELHSEAQIHRTERQLGSPIKMLQQQKQPLLDATASWDYDTGLNNLPWLPPSLTSSSSCGAIDSFFLPSPRVRFPSPSPPTLTSRLLPEFSLYRRNNTDLCNTKNRRS
jgi:hypothetical protein